jgi:hypothetical protein
MKKWGVSILSAFLTFTLGLCLAVSTRHRPAPAARNVPPVGETAGVKAQIPLLPSKVKEVAPPADEVMRPHIVSISPYEIKRLIDENYRAGRRRRWRELPLEPIWSQLGIQPGGQGSAIESCNGNCHADVVSLELDGRPGPETMLVLDSLNSSRFLIFKQAPGQHVMNAEWTLLGYIDAYGWYFDPEYRVVTAGTKRWLVVNESYGHGSGFGSYAANWYEVTERGVVDVLTYQSGLGLGALPGGRAGVERKTKVVKAQYRDDIATIVLQSSTSYEGYLEQSGPIPLWANKRTATFIQGPGMRKFMFDPLHSEMTAIELSVDLGDGENITDEEVLKYNYRDLNKLAVGGNAKQKEWLRNYLAACDDTPERESLQAALGGERP